MKELLSAYLHVAKLGLTWTPTNPSEASLIQNLTETLEALVARSNPPLEAEMESVAELSARIQANYRAQLNDDAHHRAWGKSLDKAQQAEMLLDHRATLNNYLDCLEQAESGRLRPGCAYLCCLIILEHLQDPSESLKYRQKAAHLATYIFGETHPQVALENLELGILHRKLGHLDQAQTVVEQSHDHLKKTLDPDHYYLAQCLRELSAIAAKRGRPQAARQFSQQAALIEAAWTARWPQVELFLKG